MNTEKFIILLVEDDPADQELFKQAFDQKGFDHQLFVVSNGQQALDFIMHQGDYEDDASYPTPDIMFLDINIPPFTGNELLGKLVLKAENYYISTYVLSGIDDKKLIDDSIQKGVIDYFQKPRSFEGYLELVEAFCEEWTEKTN